MSVKLNMETVTVTVRYEDAVVLMTILKGLAQIADTDEQAKQDGVQESFQNILAAFKEAMF